MLTLQEFRQVERKRFLKKFFLYSLIAYLRIAAGGKETIFKTILFIQFNRLFNYPLMLSKNCKARLEIQRILF